ncbi:MAG: M67 family metallopeptidase [Chitinophagales bacterium]
MLRFKPTVKKLMIADALHSFPDECCGFFFGEETVEARIISKAIAVENAKVGDKRRQFEISPTDYLKAEQYADEHHLQLLGVYHSHPNHPAIPSEHDRIAAQQYFSYSIISIMNKEFADLRSWRLNDEQQFAEEEISDDR